MPATITPTIRAFLRQHHIHHIVIQPGYQRAWTAVLSQIAPPPRRIGGILLYTVKPTARVARTQSVRLPA
jgi:PhoPQ-activated pathogenicity-related protein